MLPIKSLSAGNLLDYGFCLKLMAVLYLPADSFMDLGWMAKNRPLNRAQVECARAAYSEAAPASSDRRRTGGSARPPPHSRTASRRIRPSSPPSAPSSRRRRATRKGGGGARRAARRRGRRRRRRGGGDRGELWLFTRVVDATGHTDPMMELQKRGPSARAWLAIAAALAIVAVGVRFVR